MSISKLTMISLATALTFPLMASAQSQTLSVSPIPDDAENRFCYYAGLAYSIQSYIVISGRNTVTNTSNDIQERLLECISADDGSLKWVGRSKIQTDR